VKELGRERATIGLVGRLGSRLWRGEGRWPQGNDQALRAELPDAAFVDFDEELWAEVAVKSAEEIQEPAAYDERTQTGLHLSEQIVVTRNGYRRLGKLPVEFRST
jgi:hypothetical protein